MNFKNKNKVSLSDDEEDESDYPEDDDFHVMDSITDHRIRNGKDEFLVKWKGCSDG